MSISVRFPVNGEEKRFPIATAQYFKDYWLPGAKALNLRWVKQFDACLLEPNNLLEIIAELRALKDWFKENHSTEDAVWFSEHIDSLLIGLESLKTRPHFAFWIG